MAEKKKYTSKLVELVIREGEELHQAKAITFESQFDNPEKRTSPGGMCSCCGASPKVSGEDDWWLVFQAGLCDEDGVFYAMLCGGCDGSGCLEEIRAATRKRKRSFRDDVAELIAEINGDDVDGMVSDFEDAEYLGFLGIDDE